MITEKVHNTFALSVVSSKLKDYAAFTKVRLTSLVLFSAVAGYLLAADNFQWAMLGYILLGGFLVTGASNGFNQVVERDLDKLMIRTQNRPLPTHRMSVTEGLILSSLMGVAGIVILWYFLNPLSGILGALALTTYAAIYTPMKQLSPLAVYVGAIPGAIPPMIGYVAVTGKLDLVPGILFAVQFAWQFPHFWAIAWKGDGDYSKAGFRLLPSSQGKSKLVAFQIFISALVTIPVGLLPAYFGMTGLISAIVCTVSGMLFSFYAWKLYKNMDDESATKLMFASFIYLPIVLLIFVIDKI